MNRVEIPKSSSLFAGIRVAPGDPESAYLRVSSYRREQVFESEEGTATLPGHHVRFSFWTKDEAKCVISISESEARELLRFLSQSLRSSSTTGDTSPD